MRNGLLRALLPALCLLAGAVAQAQVARVTGARGTVLAERAGSAPRILGPGELLGEQDVISVARDSHAVVEFSDRTRVSLRPGTVFRIDAYREGAQESMLLGLLRGGLRAVTGLIGKRNPAAVKFHASTATIGIRGTEFDARLCEDDCGREERMRSAPFAGAVPVARVVEIKGRAAASGAGGNARMLAPGAALYEREGVATGAGSHIVLVFSDGSRISLSENSRLAVPVYRFDDRQRTGIAQIHHLGGGARVQSGAIAKQGPEYYRFITPLGVLRPRGTGWDSLVGGAKQVVDQSADAARQTGEAVVGAVQDTAGQAQQAALDAATAPIMREMSRLMHDLRNNPPATEAEASEMASRLTQMSSQLHEALDGAVRVAGAAANTDAFKTAVGLALAAELDFFAVPAAARDAHIVDGAASTGAVVSQVATARASPYQSESLALVGLSDADLERMSNTPAAAHLIIVTEVGGYLASQGNAAAREFFAEAKAAAEAMQQRAQQAEAAAARAAAEAEQRAIEDAQRAAEEARDAEREAARKAEEARQLAEQRLTEGKVRIETAAANPVIPVPGLGSVPLPAQNPLDGLQENVQAGADVAANTGKRAADSAAQTGQDIVGDVVAGGVAGAEAGADAVRNTGEVLGSTAQDAAGIEMKVAKTAIRDTAAGVESGLASALPAIIDTAKRASASGAEVGAAIGNASGAIDTLLGIAFGAASSSGSTGGGSGNPGDSSSGSGQATSAVIVWDGAVEVGGRMVGKGQLLRLAADGRVVIEEGVVAAAGGAPRPDLVAVAPGLFDDGGKPMAPGLYVWVRDGVITLKRDGEQVEVAAGHAALVTGDRMMPLDYVPNFMRFDATLLPSDGGARAPDVFRAPDGSSIGMCTVR